MLYLITSLVEMVNFLLIFAVPRDLVERYGDPMLQGQAGFYFSLTAVVVSMIAGRLSDRWGRRRIVLIGLATQLLAVGVCLAFRGEPIMLMIGLALSGAAGGFAYPALIPWITQSPRKPMIVGTARSILHPGLIRFCLAWNVGLMIGQSLGGALYSIAWYWPFAVAVPIVLVNGFLTFNLRLVRKEQAPLPPPPDSTVDLSPEVDLREQRLSHAFTSQAWLANLAGAFCVSLVFFILPQRMVSLRINPEYHGLIIGLPRIVTIATYLAMHHTRFWHHRMTTAVCTQVLAVAGMLTLALADHQAMIIVGIIMLSILTGYNYFASLYYSTSGTPMDRRGAASGWHEATLGAGFALGAMIGGIAGRSFGQRTPYLIGAGVIGALMVVQLIWYRWIRSAMARHRQLPGLSTNPAGDAANPR